MTGGNPTGIPDSQLARAFVRFGSDAPPAQPATLAAPAMIRALPEDREYDVKELNSLIRLVTTDESASRRKLIDDGWMARHGNRYWLTSLGRQAWRAERMLAGAR